MSTHKWLMKSRIHPGLSCGRKTLIKINYNYILKLNFGHWKCFAVTKDIITNGIYDHAILVIGGKYHGAIWTKSHAVMANHICGLGL